MDGVASGAILAVERLTKTFASQNGQRKSALSGVGFSAASGSLLCLLGANGSGKTTLLKILSGLILPDAGSVSIGGLSLAKEADAARGLTGFSPGEERSFYGRLTGLENLRFFSRLRGLTEEDLRERLARLDEPLGLREILGLPYQKTSAGMKQRLSLARALLHDPAVLLLDEPTKSLDPTSAEELRGFIRRQFLAKPGRAVLWSTHNLEEAWATGTRVLVLRAGKLRADGAPARLLEQARANSPLEAYQSLTKEPGP